ncbi:MAG: LuxR C-terminal-related transcriptional regulator [Leptolyngbyaceae cyanobacterium bins.59]|nr:LuxR C-terminal-related transcriptional regulator [Leptolyngbyaceae cyanobacterium bins.59]
MLTAIVTFSIQFDQQQSFVHRITQLSQADKSGSKCVSIQFVNNQFQQLSVRELEVLKLVSQGLSNPEIATALQVSQNTIKSHVRSLMNKFGVDRRVQLAMIAIARGEGLEDMIHE